MDENLSRINQWAETLKLHRESDVEAQWSKLEKRIAALRFRQNVFRFVRNAAAVLLLPALIALFQLSRSPQHSLATAQIEISAAPGQISKIHLPDGSEVWLNAGSKLTYPQQFTGNKRLVSLAGEAYFKVQADKKHRFEVNLPCGLMASAYGTEFNISTYSDDKNMEITLVTGCLEVDLPDVESNSILRPAQKVMYYKDSKTWATTGADLPVTTAWKDGKLLFRHAPIAELTAKLSRRFNVDIELKGKELHNYEYSATFTTESIDEILHLLKQTAPINYKIIEAKQNQEGAYPKRKIIIYRK
jgi:ferric-dicitrate binding protein FerR (iron transport regulator)